VSAKQPYRFQVELAIPAAELLKLYRGQARNVSVLASDGRRILFPAQALKPHVRHDGVYGRFVIIVNADNKLLSIERVSVALS
jgi:hypothetical protein